MGNMSKKSAYDSVLETNFKSEVELLKYQAEVMYNKELYFFKQLVTPDMKILEVGSGPGYITELMKKTFPNNPITCLELNDELQSIEKNTEYLKEFNDITYIQGSILESNLPFESFDLVFTCLVLMNISDGCEKAVEEIYRLLKPGRISIINEPDQNLTISDPGHDADHKYLKEKLESRNSRMDFKFGQKLPKLLIKIGFSQIKMNGIVLHPDIDQLFFKENSLIPVKYLKPQLDHGLITVDEYHYLSKYITEIVRNENSLVFTIVFIIISTK